MGQDGTVSSEDDRCTTPRKRGWEGFDGRSRSHGTLDDDRVYV